MSAHPVEEVRAKILLVDDQEENLIALEAVLESLGQDLIKARSGSDALRAMLDHDFAVILLDVKMPDMDGFETASFIRDRDRSRNTPIIFLTALKNEEHLFRGYFMGAVDYLSKPIVPDVLRSKVSVFVELYKKTEQLKRQTESLRAKYEELERVVAEKTRIEEDLRQLNMDLEDRVIRRTQELSRMNDELRQFAYIASHDLQEPLRTIGSYAQLLHRRYSSKLAPDADEFIQYIVDGVARMHSLLNDMLSYSRITGSERQPSQPVSCESVVRTAMMNLEAAIKECAAEISVESLPTILADEVQLTQVFQNLIGNSLKYKSGDQPRVVVSAKRTDSDWIFSVRDNGMGIDSRYHERIFGIFKRLHGKELPGTGMGLAICKRIVEQHGGRIWVESRPGMGSDFRFTIPA